MGFFDKLKRSHPEERKAVSEAKREVKRLTKQRDGESKQATKKVSDARSHRDSSVKKITIQLEELLNPGRGKVIQKEGSVSLFEHTIEVRGTSFDLVELNVRVESAPTATYLYFDFPDGSNRMESFSTEWRDVGITTKADGSTWVNKERAHSDEGIRHLQSTIMAAVRNESVFRERLPSLIEETRANVEIITNETEASLARAEAELKTLEEGSETVASLKQAEKILQERQATLAALKGSSDDDDSDDDSDDDEHKD